jgi:hypothetical protein
MNQEFKRMLELAGLTEIKVNIPLNFYFAVIEDGLEYREIGDNNTYLASFELDDLDAEENPWITFNISIDASYDDVDFLEDDVEEFILNASDIDPNFNIKFFKSFINNLNKVKIELTTLVKQVDDKTTQIKLNEVISLIKPISNKSSVKDEHLVTLLQYQQLAEEIKNVNG